MTFQIIEGTCGVTCSPNEDFWGIYFPLNLTLLVLLGKNDGCDFVDYLVDLMAFRFIA